MKSLKASHEQMQVFEEPDAPGEPDMGRLDNATRLVLPKTATAPASAARRHSGPYYMSLSIDVHVKHVNVHVCVYTHWAMKCMFRTFSDYIVTADGFAVGDTLGPLACEVRSKHHAPC